MRDLMNEVKVRLITSEKNILSICLFLFGYSRTKTDKKHSSNKEKRFKNVINTNNSFLRAKADYCMSRMNLVVTEHKLTFL